MIETVGLVLLGWQLLVLGYYVLVNVGYLFITVFAFRDVSHGMSATADEDQLRRRLVDANLRPVSVLVPAHNEIATIVPTVESILGSRYPEFEVVVVDDGSTDDMLPHLLAHFDAEPVDVPVQRRLQHAEVKATYLSRRHPQLLIVSKEGGGKSDALNAGIEYAQYPLVCAIDADSMLEADALLRLSQQFLLDRRLVAVGGAVRVLNGCRVEGSRITEVRAPRGLLECIQAAEYTRGFLAGRVALSRFRSLLIVSGAFGIFRKDLLVAIGGYRHTVGEDMDIVVRLHRHCIESGIDYRVSFVPEPVCWTQVPKDLRSLLRQRNRWQRGLADSLWASRGMFLRRRYGAVGLFGFPYFAFVELLGPAIEFLGYVGFIIFMMLGWVSRDFAMLFFTLAVLCGMWLNASAVLIDNLLLHRYRRLRDTLRIALLGSLEFIGIRQLVSAERLIATFQFSRRHWGRVRRHDHA